MKEIFWSTNAPVNRTLRKVPLSKIEEAIEEFEIFRSYCQEIKRRRGTLILGAEIPFGIDKVGEPQNLKITKILEGHLNNRGKFVENQTDNISYYKFKLVFVNGDLTDYHRNWSGRTPFLYGEGIIFVPDNINLNSAKGQETIRHEVAHTMAISSSGESFLKAGFCEVISTIEDGKAHQSAKGICMEEWFAVSSQKKPNGYPEIYQAGEKIVGLILKLEPEQIKNILDKFKGLSETWKTNFIKKWSIPSNREKMVRLLVADARFVWSTRMIFRDFVNCVDYRLFSSWFNTSLDDFQVQNLNSFVDRVIESKKNQANKR